MPDLKSVPTNQPEPPYPANTRVNGWRFELDQERIKRSDTWVLAEPAMRPWLLMLWMTAFDQVPAGSLPNNHKLIAAQIGMDPRQFQAHSDILLRGFIQHSDGRLYHPVVVERVQALLDFRQKERDRKAAWRAQQKQEVTANVPRDRHGTDVGVPTQEQEQEQELTTQPTVALGISNEIPRRQPQAADSCPHSKIIEIYHEVLPMMRRVRTWNGERPRILRNLWKQNPDLEWFKGYFEYVAKSPFLTGKSTDFVADLEWLVRPQNFQKVNEGKYHGGKRT